MLLVKSVDLSITEDATQGRIEELLLKDDMRASLPIDALATGLRRQTVACPEMLGNLVQAAPKDSMVFLEGFDQIRWPPSVCHGSNFVIDIKEV